MVSAPVVETVAWLALAVVLALGVVLVVLVRRMAALTRAHTDRKWEIATLRAEVAALRRGLHPDDAAGSAVEPPRTPRPWPASATAWRRDRVRTPAPPRRRPGRSARRSD